jgi:uncharacterized phage protein (TIGR01671 family)
MREHKYRARLVKKCGDKQKGLWVYGLPQQLTKIHGVVNLKTPADIGYIVSYEPEKMLQSGAADDNLYWYEIDPETLGEFTGYKDVKDAEIYEGDIFIYNAEYAVVTWDVLGSGWYECETWVVKIGGKVRGALYACLLYDFKDLSVVGNIYENQELLRVAES